MARKEYIQIYGERNSGTNYLHFLLEENIKNIKVGYKYGWKHGFAKIENVAKGPVDKELVFAVFKDPYSWIVSMHGKPHHAPQLYKTPVSQFIRSEWACYEGANYDSRDLVKDPIQPDQEMLFERNPENGERFENVIALRTAKMKRLFELKEKIPNVSLFRYEDFLFKPRIKICEIAGKERLRLKGPVKISMGYFGKNPDKKFDRKDYYDNKEYFKKFTQDDLDYINKFLDPEMEKALGYEIVTKLPVNSLI